MKIFPSLNDRKPKWREADESLFQFLCRSERAEARASREIIEKWAEDYPENDIERWLGNFRSSDDDQHTSAFFELFLYKFFSANLSVLAVEPPVAGVTGTPDFLIEDPVQGRFFVEAIAPSFRSKADVGRTKLVDNIKSDINKIIVQDYYLILEEISSPTEAFSTKPLLRELERWLQAERSADCKFEYRDKGACIKIGLLPRPGRDT